MIRKAAVIIFLLLCAASVTQAIYYYPQLPERVAKHFNMNGQPDSWASKTSFFVFYFLIISFMELLFLAISFFIHKIPASLINLPNKEYWLSEEHKKETFDFIFHYILWFGSGTILLMTDVFHQVIQFNLEKQDSLPHIRQSLALYIGFVIIWIIGFYRKFSRKNTALKLPVI